MAVAEPAYRVVLKDGEFEVRDYPAMVAAEAHMSGDRDKAGNAAFRLLAGYIFGNNIQRRDISMTAPVAMTRASGQKIAMTAPVAMSGSPDEWVMRFFMPAEYTIDMLPIPNDSRIKLIPLPPTRFAVVRFSGIASENKVAKDTARLQDFLAARRMHVAGPAILSRYDPPWTLWFLRRNEVWLQLEQ